MKKTMFLPIEVIMWVIPLVILQISTVILYLINIVNNERKSQGNKVGWSLIIILITILGALFYYFLGWEETEPNTLIRGRD
jgi:hypothetical protein